MTSQPPTPTPAPAVAPVPPPVAAAAPLPAVAAAPAAPTTPQLPESTPAAAPPGLGRAGAYELLLELASGGMATVYLGRAMDRRGGAPLVAVKRPHRHLATDKTFLTMLIDEARLASTIKHGNVVRVRELGFEAGIPFIVMDYVEGTSLAELRKELASGGRAMDVRVAIRIITDALAGLHAAHDLRDESGRHLGIIHRDVSPHNILIGCDGRTHLTDFGIAKAEDRVQTTRTHEVKGKLAYLAPERIDKRRMCTVQSDVFSMAVVLWECFAGRRLFRGEDAVETLQDVMTAQIPQLRQIGAHIPVALDDVIARALSRDLDTRYATAEEFSQAIERAVGKDSIGTDADVARLMEALFGPRMALRHAQVRDAVGSGKLEVLLDESGLPRRETAGVSTAGLAAGNVISELPPAPTGRYSFGHISPPVEKKRRLPRKPKWWLAAGASAGLLVGALLTMLFTLQRSDNPPPIVMPRAGTLAALTLPTPSTLPAPPPPAPTFRRVYVKLPFLASHVGLDDASRDLEPATEDATFDVPLESGPRHHVTATAVDGTRAEAYVREADGPVVVEGEGFVLTAPVPSHSGESRAAFQAVPAGATRHGFTKLR